MNKSALGCLLAAGFLAATELAEAQAVPSGWKVAKDLKKLCQIAVPPAWNTEKLVDSMVVSPDKQFTVVVHGFRKGVSYEGTVTTAKALSKPLKTFEESSTRTWFERTSENGQTAASWYIATGGTQVCEAQVEFKDPDMTSIAKKIALSLGPAQ